MSNKRKKIRIAIGLTIVFVILIGFPLVSVYYLDSGIDYRKEQLAKLNKLGQIGDFMAFDIDKNQYSLKDTRDHILLIVSAKQACNRNNNLTLLELYEKLKDQKGFLMLIIDDQVHQCDRYMDDFEGAVVVPQEPENKQLIGKFNRHIPEAAAGFSAMLVDREQEVRNSYDLSDVTILEELITHITILLPPSKN
jgi:hypothetical protein